MVKDMFWWPALQRDTNLHLQSCHACQVASPGNIVTAVGTWAISGLFHTFLLGFAGPLTTTIKGNRFILVAVEHLTGRPILRTVKKQATDVALKFYKR